MAVLKITVIDMVASSPVEEEDDVEVSLEGECVCFGRYRMDVDEWQAATKYIWMAMKNGPDWIRR